MIVADDKLDPGSPRAFSPTRKSRQLDRLSRGQLDRQRSGAGHPVDRHRNQHRLTGDDPGLAHLLITRVEIR